MVSTMIFLPFSKSEDTFPKKNIYFWVTTWTSQIKVPKRSCFFLLTRYCIPIMYFFFVEIMSVLRLIVSMVSTTNVKEDST